MNTKINLGLSDDLDMDELDNRNDYKAIPKVDESPKSFINPLRSTPINNDDNGGFLNNLDSFDFNSNVNIKIFGLGGAGNNMVSHIATTTNIDRKCLYAINTDFQFLKILPNNLNKLLIGKKITNGFGSGSNPTTGRNAALEDAEEFKKILKGTDLLFIVSGMGKGTGTGASPVVAQIAKEMNILTIAVVNLPSISIEGKYIHQKGLDGLEELAKYVDGLSTISNEKMMRDNNANLSLQNSFQIANDLIANIINELTSWINVATEINIDFNDIKNFFNEKTKFQINSFNFKSNENMEEAIRERITMAIYEDKIKGSNKAIVNFKLNPSVPLQFINTIRKILEDIFENKDFAMNYSIDYCENIEFAQFTLLIAIENHFNDNQFNLENDQDFENDKGQNFDLNELNDKFCEQKEQNIVDNETRKMNHVEQLLESMHNVNVGDNQIFIEDNKIGNNFELTSHFHQNVTEVSKDFQDLQEEIKLNKNNKSSPAQSVTITKQIENNVGSQINSTSLNRFFTRALGTKRITNSFRNKKNN